MAKLLDTLAHAHLGGVPCTRTDCSACAKLAAGDAGVVVMPSPTPSPETTIPDLPPVPYTPQLIPELVFAPGDANVLARVQDGIHEEARLWWLNLQANRLSLASGFDELICLPLVRGVHQYDYQIATALKVLRELRGRALLADEVGLGKTIEAALILKEYVVRGLVRKALVLVPASLTVQWQEELREKFGLHFEIMDEVEDWARHDRVISSIDTAKRDVHREEIQRLAYDVVIVDEAHKLKNRSTKNWKLVAAVRKKYMLLLTATPVQNDLEELFNLVTLLRPGHLSSYGGFKRRFVRRGDPRTPANPGELKRLLREVMIRNRRSAVLVLPPRRVFSAEIALSRPERKLYEAVTDFVRDRYPAYGRGSTSVNRLALTVLQKEMGSSTFAAAETLRRMKESPNFAYEDRRTLSDLYDRAAAIRENEKARRLRELLAKFDDKTIVFTQYLRTLQYLRPLLESDGHTVSGFHGGMTPGEKEASVREFREKTRVFLSTEAGGEGRNLQFCNTVVNFDLPWNPLKIEQRIGRVHRIGQTRDVHIVNLWARDTIEEYVMELLDKKINMFQLVVGELDLVLGRLDESRTFEDVLMEIWTVKDLARRREELARFGDQLLEARTKYESTKSYEEALFGTELAAEARA